MSEKSLNYVNNGIMNGQIITNGAHSRVCQEIISEKCGGGRVFLTASCTQALEFASVLMDLKPGDEVIIPSFNFTSGVLALVNYGVIPIFVDIRLEDLNINTEKVLDAITSRTKAISYINYAGRSADVDLLRKIADEHNLYLIEDNAHGLGATHRGEKLGSFGDISVLSFHSTKNITCGEGGALVVNNKILESRADILREKGTNRRKFLEGSVEKYQWVDKGGSYLLAEPLSAILRGQLEDFEVIQARRYQIYQTYESQLNSWVRERGFLTPTNKENSNHSAHIFYILLNDFEQRNKFIGHMKAHEIETPFHYQALHSTEAGEKYGRKIGQLANSQRASETLVRFPIWHELNNGDIEKIIETTTSFRH